jgi:hypothetical protein
MEDGFGGSQHFVLGNYRPSLRDLVPISQGTFSFEPEEPLVARIFWDFEVRFFWF